MKSSLNGKFLSTLKRGALTLYLPSSLAVGHTSLNNLRILTFLNLSKVDAHLDHVAVTCMTTCITTACAVNKIIAGADAHIETTVVGK